MKNIGLYKIGGGQGSVIKECFEGTIEEFQEWLEDRECDMFGWIEHSQDYTLPWHNGHFCKYETDEEMTISQHGVDEKDMHIDSMIIWWENDFDENNEEFYRFGIYLN